MKAEETQNGATSFLQTNSISFNSSNHQKYNGLIEQSFYKKVVNNLAQLFNYVYADAPPFTIVHNIITVIRLLQIGGPSLCAGYYSLWANHDSAHDTVSILSIFFHLIPPSVRDVASVYFLIVYMVILILLLSLIFISAFVYRKSATLPDIIPPIISFYFASFGVILHPIAFELGFSELGRTIFETSKYNLVLLIILFVVSLVVSLLYFWIYLMIAQQSIMFRPSSLLTVCSQPQTLIFLLQLVITIFTGFPETCTDQKNFQGVMLILAGLCYFAAIYIAFFYGGIVSPVWTAAFLSTLITSGIECFINAIMLYMNKSATLVNVVIYIILYIIIFIVTLNLWNKLRSRNLTILDNILDDVTQFDHIKSVNSFVNLAVHGFYVAHPVCINWQFLKLGIERWPQNQMTWFVYAKFVSIYPEETQTLAWIFRMIVTKKVRGLSAKTVKEQSLNVARQREPNLSTDLKSKLNSVSKHITSTKHKLRHVWDLAIQGNINDMEAATKRTITEIEKSDAELMHVIHQFPNNRFVTRQYARFFSELKADRQGYLDMVEKTRMLQRGITVNKDQAHEFGLAVFHQLPDKINISNDAGGMQGQGTESMTTSQIEIETEDENNQEADDSLILAQRIDSLVIPSTRYSILYRIIMVLILFVAPAVFFFVYTPIYQNSLMVPLNFIQHITMIRTFLIQITAFSETRVYESLHFFSPPAKTTTKNLLDYGGHWDTREELISITSQVSLTMQNVEEFRMYASNSKYIAKGKSNLFDAVVNYSYYTGLKPTFQMISVQTGLADFVLQQKDIVLENASIPDEIVNSSVTLNPIINLQPMQDRIDETLDNLEKFVTEKDHKYQKLLKILMISIICFCIVAFLVALIIQLVWISSNKEQVYKCLTALPKNAVSALTENLRVLKKEAENSSTANANTEMNKQEDNIMKIFVIGGSSSSTKLLDAILLITSTLVMVGLHVGCTVVFISLMQNQSKYIRQNSPHLNYLQGAYSNVIGCASSIIILGINEHPLRRIGPMTKEFALDQYNIRIKKATEFYHKTRFGGESIEDPPYSGFLDGVKYAQDQMECIDPRNTSDLLEISKCYSPDLLYILIESVWQSIIQPFIQDNEREGLGDEKANNIIWSFLIFPIYYAFFYPMSMSIVGNIEDHLSSLKNSYMPRFIVMFAIAIIFEIIATIQALRIEKHMKKVLKLLLHVPTKIVMQTPKIMRVLGGDFKKNRGDGATRDNEFFRSVVQNLPDAVLVANTDLIVESVNKSFTRIISIEESNIIGKSINDFFNEKFTGNVSVLLQVANGGKSKTENLTYHKDTEINLEATSYLINQRLVILFRDTTQTVRYNTLIKEEKLKSDVMLSSILPPSLVKRVQAGEQNISFAVQTATIVFMDIVSFTPWCGSLPADKVMSTLNNLFRRFDAALARQPTMTKIKCIGDCYMAAGGVFAEVNQPAEHAKEVVLFGLDALNCIVELNEELDEKLQIRVGINTGGPIVAGVLGIGKPTFEIIGSAINMAQQMEHHGVPMQVHVSRSVYELIYGDTFVIKERGQIEVKGGSVITYLVSKPK